MEPFDVRDPALQSEGVRRIEWASSEMPVLAGLRQRLEQDRPLAGIRIGGCLHITTETANLARTLQAAGADLRLCASNPLSTQDDVAAALVGHYQIPVFARRGESVEVYYRHLNAVLDFAPQITLDDGADLISRLHQSRREQLPNVLGGTEETTTGLLRLRAMAREGALTYPVIAVNDADTKHLFDNRFGTGQSTLDGVMRATNILLAGRVLVVAGYGWCGRGIASRARGMGSNVVVTEVDPVRALEAALDGFQVMPMLKAAAIADLIITATGDRAVVEAAHFAVMKDGCILANSGHFDVEVDVAALRGLAQETTRPRLHVEEFHLADGRRLRLLAQGRLVNLGAAEGHPAAVMDMSFANQALSVVHLVRMQGTLAPQVHPVPREIDCEIAHLKLAALGLAIDHLTPAQESYLSAWREGT